MGHAPAPDDRASAHALTRRGFLAAGAAAGGGLLLSVGLPRLARRAQAEGSAAAGEFAPNAFLRVGRDGRAALIVDKCEVGQGVYTSFPMLIAEELEVGLDQVTVEPAPPDDKVYADPILHFQCTGNSTSVRGGWDRLRHAGAVGRVMLIEAAAQTWQVDPATCRAEHGQVIHDPTGRKLGYGALADKAATLPVPQNAPLKERKDWRLIGTSPLRLDLPGKVDGSAQFGIDVRLPGMKIATVAHCPVIGGKLGRVDASRAQQVKGVYRVVPLATAVAVVADHMWAAIQGVAALDIEWDEGPHPNLALRDIVRQLDDASQRTGVIAHNDGDAAKAMAGAAKRIDAIYQDPFLAHAPMEPVNCTVHVRPDLCEMWVASQVQGRAHQAGVEITGLPPEKVILHNYISGGAFGRRLETDFIGEALLIAKQVDVPVKVVWTREEDIQHDLYRPYYYDRMSAGLDAQGRPVAWTHRIVGSSVMARFAPSALGKDGLDPDAIECAAPPVYDFPSLHVEYVRQEPPAGITTAFWRGVGPTHNVFVVESFIDELAAAAKQDPIQYRRALLDK